MHLVHTLIKLRFQKSDECTMRISVHNRQHPCASVADIVCMGAQKVQHVGHAGTWYSEFLPFFQSVS